MGIPIAFLTLKTDVMENFKSPADALSDLRRRGYNSDFSIETFCLYCGDLDMRLYPDQFNVDEEYRFGAGNAHEEDTVVVAITSSNGIKGTLMESYDTYALSSTLGLSLNSGVSK